MSADSLHALLLDRLLRVRQHWMRGADFIHRVCGVGLAATQEDVERDVPPALRALAAAGTHEPAAVRERVDDAYGSVLAAAQQLSAGLRHGFPEPGLTMLALETAEELLDALAPHGSATSEPVRRVLLEGVSLEAAARAAR